MEKENTNITKDEAQQVSSFAKYRGKLKELYSTDREVRNRLGVSSPLAGLSKVKTKDAQDLYSEAVADPSKAADISLAAYYMSNAYESIINYYKTFFYIRYTVVPRLLSESIHADTETETGQFEEEYGKIYYRMMNAVEGINLETTLPAIAEEALIKGKCSIITEKHKSTDTIVTYFLPHNYYKSVGKSEFGTNIVAFDFKYFDELESASRSVNPNGIYGTDFDVLLEQMPKILQEGYQKYKRDKNLRWQVLEPRYCTEFNFNELTIPPRLGAFPASVDYNSYKEIKLDNAAQTLDHILTHQIPTNSDGDLIMDVDEALDVTRNMCNALKEIPNVKVITTFGKTDIHDLQANVNEQSEILNTAYNNIYNSAGVDYHVFVSDKDLEVSLNRDKAFMWDFYKKVMLFYNITINDLLNFKPYQCKINLLPICVQMEDEDAQRYIEFAGAGIGRLNAVVASGIKQIDLEDAYNVEKFLNFDKILKPLQSMYTSSYKANLDEKAAEESENISNTVPEDNSNSNETSDNPDTEGA